MRFPNATEDAKMPAAPAKAAGRYRRARGESRIPARPKAAQRGEAERRSDKQGRRPRSDAKPSADRTNRRAKSERVDSPRGNAGRGARRWNRRHLSRVAVCTPTRRDELGAEPATAHASTASGGIRDVVKRAAPDGSEKLILVSTVQGIEVDTCMRMDPVFEEVLDPVHPPRLVLLSRSLVRPRDRGRGEPGGPRGCVRPTPPAWRTRIENTFSYRSQFNPDQLPMAATVPGVLA